MKSLEIIILTLSLILLVDIASVSGNRQIQFVQNKGQWDPEILFRARIENGFLLVTRSGLHYVFYDSEKVSSFHTGGHLNSAATRNAYALNNNSRTIQMHALELNFTGSSQKMTIEPGDRSKAYYNYFIGKDSSRWTGHVPVFHELTMRNLYRDTDLRLYSMASHLKYDLILRPGASAEDIRFAYNGAEDMQMKLNSIYTKTSLNTLIDNTPYAYQVVSGDTLSIKCRYRLENNNLTFALPEGYDKSKILIIDPLLVFSTYSGSTADNWGNTATFDEMGDVYSGGTVWMEHNGSLPVTPGAYQTYFSGVWDLAILKFDSTGSQLLYGTYFGGSGTETPFSMIVNSKNELVIYGATGSGDLPVTSNAYSKEFHGGDAITNALGPYNDALLFFGVDFMQGSDLFIAKLSSDGSRLLASTYLGGTENDGVNNAPGYPLSRNYGDEFRGEVNIDSQDNIYIAGNTSSLDFPLENPTQDSYGGGYHDAILAKFSPDLSDLIFSSYLGGSDEDAAYGLRITNNGKLYVTGGTKSADFPVTNNAYHRIFGGDVDGFATEIALDSTAIIASTYVGTNQYDQSYFIDIDQDGNIYLYGQTVGQYPVSDNVYQNKNSGQFIQKLTSNLSISLWSTVVGSGSGIPDISPTAFLVNECGNIFLSGWGGVINQHASKYVGGNTFNMPTTPDAFQKSTDGSDFYLMVLSSDVKDILYGTFLGAFQTTGWDGEHVDGGTSRFDKRGIVYHAICACRDHSLFPTTPGVWSNTNDCPPGCNNGVFKFDLSALKAKFTTNTPYFNSPGISTGCYPFNVVFLNRSIGGKLFEWEFGDQSPTSFQKDSIYHTYKDAGYYNVTLKAYDENTCLKVDVAKGKIEVFEPHFKIPEDRTICQGTETELKASGAIKYLWSPSYGLNDSTIANPVASPDSTFVYAVYMKDVNQCIDSGLVKVSVIPKIYNDFRIEKIYNCKTYPNIRIINQSVNANQYLLDFGDGADTLLTDSLSQIIHEYPEAGNYIFRMSASNKNQCTENKETRVQISDLFIPNIITPNADNKNESFTIFSDARMGISIFNRWGKLLYQENDYRNNWKASGLPAGVYYYELRLEDDAVCNGWIQVLK